MSAANPQTDSASARDLAAQYLDQGWALVPIPRGEKGPRHSGWNLRENCLTSPDQLGRIDGNVGLAHAYSGTAALDIDDLEKTRAYLKERGIDLDALLDAADAVGISSGKPNRAKLLYRLPEGCGPLPSQKTAEGNVTIFELRCTARNGRTVQDVLPPSIHPDTGKPYQWTGKGDWRHLPVLPEPLRAFWNELLRPKRAPAGAPRPKGPPVDRAEVRSALAAIDPDCTYDEWLRIGMALHSTGADWAFGEWDDWSKNGSKYEGEADLEKHWNSFNGDGNVTIGTLFHLARKNGWKRNASSGPFTIGPDGVYHNGTSTGGEPKTTWVCSQLQVVASGHDHNSEGWAQLLEFSDRDGKPHRWLMPLSMLSGSGEALRTELLNRGLQISTTPRGRQLLMEFLQQAAPDQRVRTVEQTGWHGDCFVFPDRTIGENDEAFLFQGDPAAGQRFATAGTLEPLP